MARQKMSNPVAVPEAGQTTIGPHIQVKGRIGGEEDLRVEGRVDGAIELSQTLYVEDGGVVVAQVQARDVVVRGIVVGDVSATDSVTLESGAKLVGDIVAPRLIIADGAAFRGSVKMHGGAAPRPRPAARASRPTATPAARSSSRPAAPPRVRAPRPEVAAAAAAAGDDEVTAVVRHAALSDAQKRAARSPAKKAAGPAAGASRKAPKKAPKKKATKKKATKKKAARARVPARKKRKVSRR